MENKPLVSVIMCFLNSEKFIREAIESVIQQTYDNWELILVDDGSTDDSTSIAKSYVERFTTRVRYFDHDGHQNKGTSASYNLGIKNTKGEYIAFLDSDDIWLPQNLDIQVENMASNPDAGMVYGLGQFWYSWTGNHEDRDKDFITELGVTPDLLYKPLSLLALFLKDESVLPLMCCVLIKRNLIERIDGFEETFPGLYEDQVLYAKICSESPIFVHSKCLAKYRRHPDSLCAVAIQAGFKKNGQYHSARLKFLNWVESYLLMKRIRNPKILWVLKKELLPYRHPTLHHLITRTPKSVSSHVRGVILKIIPAQVKNAAKRLLRYKTS